MIKNFCLNKACCFTRQGKIKGIGRRWLGWEMVGVVSRKSFKTRIGRSFTPLLILVLLLHGTASALDPSKSLTQYRLDVWKEKAGLPQSVVTDIVQTRDGYIWLATEGGLVRFDGV